MTRLLRALPAAVALLAVAGAIVALRAATQSTHTPQPPDSRLEVVVDADLRPGADGTLAEMTTAQVTACTLEVTSRPTGPVRPDPADPTRFRVTLQPALDASDRVQLRGCIEDWRIDHLRVRVLSMTPRTT